MYVKGGTVRDTGTHWYTTNVTQKYVNVFPDVNVHCLLFAFKYHTLFSLCLFLSLTVNILYLREIKSIRNTFFIIVSHIPNQHNMSKIYTVYIVAYHSWQSPLNQCTNYYKFSIRCSIFLTSYF